jgi:ABC-type transporter Mla subunit MlaD
VPDHAADHADEEAEGKARVLNTIGGVLSQWAQDLQDLSDPLDDNKTLDQLSPVWNRLKACLNHVNQFLSPTDKAAAPAAGSTLDDVAVTVDVSPKPEHKLQEVQRTLREQSGVMEARLAVRKDLQEAGMAMIDPVPLSSPQSPRHDQFLDRTVSVGLVGH